MRSSQQWLHTAKKAQAFILDLALQQNADEAFAIACIAKRNALTQAMAAQAIDPREYEQAYNIRIAMELDELAETEKQESFTA